MSEDYYLCRYKEGKFVDKSPYAMTKREANSLLLIAIGKGDGFDYKVKHRKEIGA